MATLSRQMLKLIAVAGTVPAAGIAIGYRMRYVQAAENSSRGAGGNRIYKARELPIYPPKDEETTEPCVDGYTKNTVQQQITAARKATQDFLLRFKDTYEMAKEKAETGVEHSKSSLDYIQNNPGELPRVIFIALAGMFGVVVGYRGGMMRKMTYATIGVLSSAAICYPNRSVELTKEGSEMLKQYWKEIGGNELYVKYWPFYKPEEGADSGK